MILGFIYLSKSIHLVKSISGSPSLNIVKCSLGSELYINLWTGDYTAPYDLIVADHILKGAGGKMLDKAGNEIDSSKHNGFFLAGIDDSKMNSILNLLNK